MTAAMSRYVRSFAGYSVFSFVFGIGDRHLENILLRRDGRLLHVDFGYILGNDPKPFPPPMKISKEMIDVLGGPQNAQYIEFKSYCSSAYNILRKHASLLLNLLLLMNHATGLPQLTGNDNSKTYDSGSISSTVTAAATVTATNTTSTNSSSSNHLTSE
uniref:Phosphatidylinositol 3-kinase, root isoform n=1 Tax=Lygus hesperus TaxID=30085 RepID=A0A0A9YDS8_LYGHE